MLKKSATPEQEEETKGTIVFDNEWTDLER